MSRKKRAQVNILAQVLLFIVLIIIDQVTKLIAAANLKGNNSVIVLKDILEFEYLENFGAAFGSMQNMQWLFYIISAIVIIVLIFIFIKNAKMSKKYSIFEDDKFNNQIFNNRIFLNYLLVTLGAGAIGNLIDRIFHKYVIDFIYFKIIDFWIFNFADICVTVSGILLVIYFLFIYKEDDNYVIFAKRSKNE